MRVLFAQPRWVSILLLVCTWGLVGSHANAQVGVNVFGFSKHFGNDYREEIHSFNPGLGFHWTFDRGERTSLEFNTGFYQDSFGNINRHAGLGARVQLWGPLEIGVNVLLSKSLSMKGGNAQLYPLPFLSLRQSRFVINSIFIPELGWDQSIPIIGLTATIFPFQNGYHWDDPLYKNPQRRSFLEFNIHDLTALQGYRNLGIAWRLMFKPQHGLRLGFGFSGKMWFGESKPFSQFETRVLAQYLHRYSSEKKSGFYGAIGGRIIYWDELLETLMNYQMLLNLGWEYSLNSSFSIFVETGLALSNRHGYWQVGIGGDFIMKEFQTDLESDGVSIGLAVGL